jgi:two-component system sensor histidine kinase/response regulator
MNDEFDALELVERIAAREASAARAAHLQIVSFCSPQLPRWMKGNAEPLERLLTGLTRNSIAQATQNGAVMVEILQDLHVETEQVRFAVCDSRTELGADELERHKQELLNIDVDGHRLRGLLDELGAELEFDERLVGRATRYFINLPLHRAGVRAADDFELSEKVRQARLFIVANDPYPNRIIQYYIRFHNIVLLGAPTAAEAFEVIGTNAAAGQPFDLIMVAPPIEDMTAEEIVGTLRASKYVNQAKLLYVAPLDVADDKLKAMQLGFDAAIAKPFTKVTLFQTLEQLVGRVPKNPPERPLVLIVDDNMINLKVALFQVRKMGFEGVPVDSGEEALQAFESGSFAAILMDLQMPGMSGIDAVKEIRRREKGSDRRTPIIALTGASALEEDAMAAGCDDFLLKPVAKEVLAKSFDRLVSTKVLEQAQEAGRR